MLILTVRTLLLIIIVTISIRLMGKRTIGEMQASELVVTLMISDLAVVPMQETGMPLLSGIIPIAVLVSAEIITSALLLKNAKLWRLINGRPVIIIRDGRIDQQALRMLRMTNEDLFEELRKKDVFRISSVKYAIIETDGQLSVLQYAAEMPLTAADAGKMSVQTEAEFLVVSDGDIDANSMSLAGLDEKKIRRAAEKSGVPLDEVFIMTASLDGKTRIVRKEREKHEK